MSGDRYAFIVDWLDPQAQIVFKYQLMYYTVDGSLEMYDIKNRRVFLKRCVYPSVSVEHLYVGSIITIYSRQLNIVEYADEYTHQAMEKQRAKTLGLIKPDGMKNMGKIIHAIYRSGFLINKLKIVQLSPAEAQQFYSCHKGKPFYDKLCSFMSSGPICAMELVAEDGIAKWRTLLGPTNTADAKAQAPNSLRAHFGTDGTMNACHGSDAPDTAAQELNFFFNSPRKCFSGKGGSTLCIIKPHAVLAGHAGMIIDAVQKKYKITGAEMFVISRPNAMEFYEIYKGVCAEYTSMVEQLCEEKFIALEVSDPDGENPVDAFRELCGPPDPEIARVLRPDTIRAQFGTDKVKNAVHCTDLAEDGQLEVTYFFDLLQGC